MKRRSFLQSSAALAGLAIVPGIDSCISNGKSGAPSKLSEIGPQTNLVKSYGDMFRKGTLSPKELAEHYLARIAAIDKAGPGLNSIIELNPDVLSDAVRAGEELIEGKDKGPLHGIPILLKDNIDTADRMHTTAGSLALADSYALKDSFIVQRLRTAGAVILGKTNLSEWANMRSTRSSSGWSGRGGQTRNPYYIDCNPCGSSSGSAVAVSARLCAVAIGTETDGSIVCPSSTNGIVGIKPTVGLWSRTGIIPISHTQDTAGPMAISVADAAALLGICIGRDLMDRATESCPFSPETDFTSNLDPDGLRGARIGVDRSSMGFNAEVDRLQEDAIVLMRKLGAVITDPASLAIPPEAGAAELEVLLYEFKAGLNKYLAGCAPEVKVRSLEDLIRFNEEHRELEMPWFGQELLHAAQAKAGLDDPKYQEALEKSLRFSRQEGIDNVLRTNQLDVLVAPTGGPAWKTDWVNGDHFSGGSSSASACAGYPAITVPLGQVHGLPVGISFMGAAWSEPLLIRLAYAFEQASAGRIEPAFHSSLQG